MAVEQIKTVVAPSGKCGRVRKRTESDKAEVGKDSPAPDVCVSCGAKLLFVDETRLCATCNTQPIIDLATEFSALVSSDDSSENVIIRCPGASRYNDTTGAVVEGAEFVDDSDGSYRARIVARPLFPSGHTKLRVISRPALGRIRRCQTCQDYTVRLKRKEGADFCVPSRRFPNRKALKSVTDISHRD